MTVQKKQYRKTDRQFQSAVWWGPNNTPRGKDVYLFISNNNCASSAALAEVCVLLNTLKSSFICDWELPAASRFALTQWHVLDPGVKFSRIPPEKPDPRSGTSVLGSGTSVWGSGT